MPRALVTSTFRNWKPKEKLAFSAVKPNPHKRTTHTHTHTQFHSWTLHGLYKYMTTKGDTRNSNLHTKFALKIKINDNLQKCLPRWKKIDSHNKFVTRPNSPHCLVSPSAMNSSFTSAVRAVVSHSVSPFRWRSHPNRSANSERLGVETVTHILGPYSHAVPSPTLPRCLFHHRP